ncbi:MAG: hypothetical protein FWH35_06330, partial [Treponema sp.]|nr:hypothetical protein [Treponema sp.]
TAKIIHKTDALWLVDQDDRIMDAVLLSETSGDAWKTKDSAVLTAAEFLAGKKAWLSSSGETPERWIPSPSDAVITGGTTNTRTICRDEAIRPVRRAANWYITASSSATPGKPNNIKRYVPN